jgi:hypothetical protein
LLLRIARRCRRWRLRRHSRRRGIPRGRSRLVLVRRCSLYCWRRSIRVRRLLLCFRWRTKHAARKRDRASGQNCRSGHSSPGSIGLCGHLLVVAARPQANQFGGRGLSPVMRNYKGHPSQGRPDRPENGSLALFGPTQRKSRVFTLMASM